MDLSELLNDFESTLSDPDFERAEEEPEPELI